MAQPVTPVLESTSATTIQPGGAPLLVPQKGDTSGNAMVSMGTKISGERQLEDWIQVMPISTPLNITASTLIKSGAGRIMGFYVNSTTTGVIKFWDNTSAATTAITGNITPAVGPHVFSTAAAFGVGLYAQVVSGTIDITVFSI